MNRVQRREWRRARRRSELSWGVAFALGITAIVGGLWYNGERVDNAVSRYAGTVVEPSIVPSRIVDNALDHAAQCGGRVFIEWNRVQQDWEVLVGDCDQ